jgi:hypothetical protein
MVPYHHVAGRAEWAREHWTPMQIALSYGCLHDAKRALVMGRIDPADASSVRVLLVRGTKACTSPFHDLRPALLEALLDDKSAG